MSRRASKLRAPRSTAARRYPSSEAARDQDDLVLFTEGAANLFAAPDLGRASAIGGSGRPEPARPMSQLGRTQPAAADPTTQGGQFWTPIGGQYSTPVDSPARSAHRCLPRHGARRLGGG